MREVLHTTAARVENKDLLHSVLNIMVGAPKFSRQQWLTLIGIGSVYFTSAICISLQAPFYPKEAESKGATATEYGLVFGVFELVAFLFSPVFGKYINRVGATAMLNVGCLVAALSSMLFGLLDYVHDHTAFITLSFILRITESLGTCASVVAAFSIIAEIFPESVATTFATMEVFYGLGFITGPLVGGAIYGLGGFVLPFMVLGGVLLLDSAFLFFVMPRVKGRRSGDVPISNRNTRTGKKGNLLSLIKVPSVALDTFCTIAAALSLGFYTATLEPHLRQFELSPLVTGSVIVISGALYTLSAPLIGRLCDTKVYPKKFISLGSVLIILSYFLVGPFPLFPFGPALWMIVLGLVFHGIGFACILVPCFIDSLRSALASGFPDNIVTYGLVSGLWMSAFSLGAFVGPSMGGLLLDTVKFRMATLFVIAVHSIVFVLGLCFLFLEKRVPVPRVVEDDGTFETSSTLQLGGSRLPVVTAPSTAESAAYAPAASKEDGKAPAGGGGRFVRVDMNHQEVNGKTKEEVAPILHRPD